MKKAILVAAGVFYSLCATAQHATNLIQPGNKTVTEVRKSGDYTSLVVKGPFDVKLIKDDGHDIKICGAENILPLIETETADGTLYIRLKDSLQIKPGRHNAVSITIPYSVLNAVSLCGAGNITSSNILNTNLSLKLDGSGSISLKLYGPKATVNMIGSGKVVLTGFSESFAGRLTGSGTIDASHLESDITDTDLTGSGSIKVSSNKKIKGRINGSGSIVFAGRPEGQDLMRSGTGEFEAF